MTTDHLGKVIQVKTVRTEALPKMIPSTTKQTVSVKREVAVREESKKLQALKA